MANRFPPRAFAWWLMPLLVLLTLDRVAIAQPLSPFSQEYAATSSGVPFSISAQRSLSQDKNGLWHLKVQARNWLGEITEATTFEWQDCQAITREYTYSRKGLGREKSALIRIDNDQQLAEGKRNGHAVSYSVADPVSDKLSHILSLQCMLQRGDQDLAVDVADEKGLETLRYRATGEEWLDTDAGKLLAVRVERLRDQNAGRETVLWFAKAHDYNLVRLLQVEDDKQHQLSIRRFD